MPQHRPGYPDRKVVGGSFIKIFTFKDDRKIIISFTLLLVIIITHFCLIKVWAGYEAEKNLQQEMVNNKDKQDFLRDHCTKIAGTTGQGAYATYSCDDDSIR